MKTETDIARLEAMEKRLDACAEATRALQDALDGMAALKDDMTALFTYYGSEQWHDDREADERGLWPATLKRGILSEDLVYDEIVAARDAALDKLKLSYDILKERI